MKNNYRDLVSHMPGAQKELPLKRELIVNKLTIGIILLLDDKILIPVDSGCSKRAE